MVHLDRENGAILLPNGSVVPYDILVLCTGLQVRRLGLAVTFAPWGRHGDSFPVYMDSSTENHLP